MIKTIKRKLGSVKIPVRERIFNAGYGIGASIVILGALFKLVHWNYANEMLIVGMITEAIIFAISAFEKPLKTYEWDKVIDFENGKLDMQIDPNLFGNIAAQAGSAVTPPYSQTVPMQQAPQASQAPQVIQAPQTAPNAYPGVTNVEGLSDDDAQRLSQSIQNLAKTASQLNDIAEFSLETERFANNIRKVSENTSRYAQSQESLIDSTQNLQEIYQRIGMDTEKIEVNTREYRSRVERINSNLAGMNSIYEIQLKDIHAQSVYFHNQSEISKKMAVDMNNITGEMSKLLEVSDDFSLATEKLKTNANELADNIAKLNGIYGNMLNAMN